MILSCNDKVDCVRKVKITFVANSGLEEQLNITDEVSSLFVPYYYLYITISGQNIFGGSKIIY